MELNNAQKERLYKLSEECAEVIQMVSKILLHGYNEVYPGQSLTNRQRLEHELGDIDYWLDQMVAQTDINPKAIHIRSSNKHTKAMKYTKYQEGSKFNEKD